MTDILITAGLFLLIIVGLFLILVVLMQRANTNAGMGAAFGGGLTESAFGTEASSVMSKTTWITAIMFFVLGFGLYLGILADKTAVAEEEGLPMFDDEVVTAPAGGLGPIQAQSTEMQPSESDTTPLPADGSTTLQIPVAPQAVQPEAETPSPVAE